MGIRFSESWNQLFPPWTWNEYLVLPAEPFFVMMLMTPRAASVPYSVAAAGPFSTSTLSISLGSKSLRRDTTPELNACTKIPLPVALFTRMPSTYTSGWLESENVPMPRMRMLAPEPTIPVPGSTTTTGVRPFRRASTDGRAVFAVTSATLTVATEVPRERSCSPPAVPVTTT